jgi:hypothetical protein
MHKFLFEQKTWKAKGSYLDEKGRKVGVTGTTKITHQWNRWTIEADMIVPIKGNKAFELRNVYNIKPLKAGQIETTWTSENKIVGKFTGRFFIAGNAIISTYATKDGKYTGYDIFRLLNTGKYENTGEDYFEGKRASSWSVVLS